MTARTIAGPLWYEWIKYGRNDEPYFQRGIGMEERHPWRKGACRILRFPFSTRGVAVGLWTGVQPSSDVDGFPTLTLKDIGNWRADAVGEE